MKKLLPKIAGAIALASAVFAQTAISPQPIDWRFSYWFDDPNPAGYVQAFTVTASNSPVNVKISTTRATSIDLAGMLSGLPAGVYVVYNTATSTLGDVSDPSVPIFVSWPGGNGRIRPGQNPRANK